MPDIDLVAIAARLGHRRRTATFAEPGSLSAAAAPVQWRAIAESDDAEHRRLSALTLWNREFLDLIPDHARKLTTHLLDVRVCEFSDRGFVLAYLFDTANGITPWIGGDPAAFGDTNPVFWECIPPPAQAFLREVHAGYTLSDQLSRGLTHPRHMVTMVEKWSDDYSVPEWLEELWFHNCEAIDPRRIMFVTQTHDSFEMAVSPDLPAGKALVIYDSEADMVDFNHELDGIMSSSI